MRRIGLLLVVSNVLWLVACGSSSSGGGGSSTITSVTVSCSPATILYGQTSQCSATVMGTGSFSSGVTWAASAGTISTSGLFTAPSGGVTSLQVTITATSTQDTSKSGTATVTVNPAQQSSNVQPIVVDAGPVGLNPPRSMCHLSPSRFACPEVPRSVRRSITFRWTPVRPACACCPRVVNDPHSPTQNDSSGNPLDECLAFLGRICVGPGCDGGYHRGWRKGFVGPSASLDSSSGSPPVPSSCSSQSIGA